MDVEEGSWALHRPYLGKYMAWNGLCSLQSEYTEIHIKSTTSKNERKIKNSIKGLWNSEV